MSLLTSLIFRDPWAWILSVLVGFVTFYVARFYLKVKSLPPGPMPLPILGNISMFRRKKENIFETIIALEKKYGKLYTVWMGNIPMIFLSDLDVIREAFHERKNDFNGRPKLGETFEGFYKEGNETASDIIFADYGPTWHALRTVAHSAVRKYATSEKLATLVSDVVDDVVPLILEKEKNDANETKAFDPAHYIYLIVYNILASSAFGRRYSIDDEEFLRLKRMNEEFKELGNEAFLVELVPILRYVPYLNKGMIKGKQLIAEFKDVIGNKYNSHLKDFQEGEVRDFTDALINARVESEAADKETRKHLKDANLKLAIFNLFTAGSDTTQFTLRWMFYLMANDPNVQNKLRKEIESVIGERRPVQEDMNQCHYVRAFISECQRYRDINPLGVFHAAICDTELAGYKIPKGTMVWPSHWSVSFNPKLWKEPENFQPERFLEPENGSNNPEKLVYVSTKPTGFIPFGTGRRTCLGEKLALVDLFLALVRFLQQTDGYQLVPEHGPGTADLGPDPMQQMLCTPKENKLKLQRA